MKMAFLNPVNFLDIGIPQGIALLSAIVKERGHEVKVIDTAFMKTGEYIRPNAGDTIYKPTEYDLHDLVENDPVVNVVEEVQKQIDDFKPDLLGVSVMTTNYQYAVDLLKCVEVSCPVLFGGVHPTLCPEEVLSNEFVDIVCVGEGDEAIPELCDAIEHGETYDNILNLWVKVNGNIVRNPQRPFVDLDSLPVPDWELFDDRHLFRPYEGHVYKGGFFVTSRGCPGKCTYCVNEALQKICEGCGPYFRRMSPKKIAEQIRILKEKYGVTWFKFGDDTFLLHSIPEFEELHDLIKPLNIMFGCSVRPDTVNKRKVELLKDMGCVAMSVGIESGNETLRRGQLHRQISDEQIENALKWIGEAGIRISTFNLIGIPEESREDVYMTIRMNKRLGVKAANAYILYPFPRSIIYDKFCVSILGEDGKIIPMNEADRFNFSKMSREDMVGLQRTFNLYLTLPEVLWPIIRFAEDDSERGNILFETLKKYAITIV